MWRIVSNEWRYYFRSKLLFGIVTGFFLVLLLSTVLGHLQYQKQVSGYEAATRHLREQWENIEAMNPHSAAHYGTYVFKPVNLLSSLDEGVNAATGNVLRVEGHVQNEMVHSEASQMTMVSRFGKLKSSLLLKYLVPLLLIFLAFNSVSSEKQQGRLKLLVLQGARPGQLILAKTLAIWIFGLLLLGGVVLVHTLLDIPHLTGDVLSRTLLFFLSYALYYFIITGLTVFFSSQWQSATVALTSMLGIWILWTIFLPQLLLSSVEKWYPLPSRNEFKAALRADRAKGLDGHNPADERGKELEQKILAEYQVDSLAQLPINFDGIRMQADEEYGNLVWDKHFGELRQVLARQKRSLQAGGFLNPFLSLQNASMGFAASDNLHHQEFLLQVENYRRGFIKTLNDKHTYGGSKTGDWGWKADNEFFKSVPDFSYQPATLATVFRSYLPDLVSLVLWSLVVMGLLSYGARKMRIL